MANYQLTHEEGVTLAGRLSSAEIRLDTNVCLVLRGPDGTLREQRDYHNTIAQAGMAAVAALLCGEGTVAVFDYIALGTGTGAEDETDTALGTEITQYGGARARDADTGVTTITHTNDTAVIDKLFTFSGLPGGGPLAITESGLFNAASTGTMLARKMFAALNVYDGDTLTVTWKITVGV